MKTLPNVALACVVVSLCACASLPKATVTYYPAKTSMTVDVLRTIKCNSQHQLVEAMAVTPNVVQAADIDHPHTLEVTALSDFMADTDFTVGLYDDGRLKSVNGGTTGQGETVLSTAFTLLAAVIYGLDASSDEAICTQIKKEDPDNKGIALTYSGEVNLDSPIIEKIIPLAKESVIQDHDLISSLQDITASSGSTTCKKANGDEIFPMPGRKHHPVEYSPDDLNAYSAESTSKSRIELELIDPKLTLVTVCSKRTNSLIWSGIVPVAQQGNSYQIYFPKRAHFGSASLSVGLAESGALTSIEYKRGSGTADALKTISAAAGAKESALEAGTAKDKAWLDRQATNLKMVNCKIDKTKC